MFNLLTSVKRLALLITACLFLNVTIAQVTININSGNPNFPFPQFKKYTGSAFTLAEVNPIKANIV